MTNSVILMCCCLVVFVLLSNSDCTLICINLYFFDCYCVLSDKYVPVRTYISTHMSVCVCMYMHVLCMNGICTRIIYLNPYNIVTNLKF